MRNRKGISLIVLIITIIVVIILAAVVILTLSKNNPIESAKEARFKEDVRTFQDELALYISKQYTNAGGHWDGNISAKTCDEIINYIPSFTKKYEGKFIINNNNLEYTNKLEEKEKEYAKNLNVKERVKLLPDEYQQVEYIESTGTQYIDSKYKPNQDTSAIIEISASLENDDRGNVFGSRTSSGNEYFGLHLVTKYYGMQYTGYRILYNNNYVVYSFGSDSQFLDKRVVELDKNKLIIDGVEKCSLPKGEFQCKYNALIFADNVYGTPRLCSNSKIYNLKIFELEDIKKIFIPCYSITTVEDVDGKECPSSTKGLYDTVEGKFYTNQGTGEFIAGPDVNE